MAILVELIELGELYELGELDELGELGELGEWGELCELDERVDQADMLARGLLLAQVWNYHPATDWPTWVGSRDASASKNKF